MGHRLSKIYTRTGDDGTTGLGDGQRVSKDDLRVETYGTVDELNSAIGLLRASLTERNQGETLDPLLSRIQHELFDLGGELCIPNYRILQNECVNRLEKSIDQMNETLPMLKNFILPAGSVPTAHAHLARSICRRAERLLTSLKHREDNVSDLSLHYLNRLSDWLFVAARVISRFDGGQEVLWVRQDAETK
ncbi:cob(I)yrinic acid a,c-diamide adenosyltransferase [Aquirhabdus sp.]|uniref:cob(I)yrinic acid a,c-diamide adenosyltransferase n=1 Tax=Aquirhabdus sp. TaxID=2824160 RepID=UPI00396CCC76